jgi:hypothetical protein
MTWKRLLSYVILTGIFVLILLMQRCQHQKEVDGLVTNISEYKDTALFYKAENGELVAYNKSLVLQNETQAKALLSKDEDFRILLEGLKELDAAGSVTTIIKVKHDTIELHDTIPCDFDPIPMNKNTDGYDFYGHITPSDLIIDSLHVPNTMKFVVGEQKTGWFKKEKRIEVINTNPLVETTGITAYTIEEDRKGLKYTLIAIGGAIIGIITERLVIKH